MPDSHLATRHASGTALLTPLRRFLDTEASGGALLLAAAAAALVWANSPVGETYEAVWQHPVGVTLGDGGLTKPLQLWINDGLMAIFFFVVGLEIKRELLIGELSSARQAVLQIAAAIAGALLPALIFLGFTPASGGVSRWRPMSHSPWASWPCWGPACLSVSRFS